MTLTEFPDLEQRSEEWHAVRRGIVTASNVKTLLTPTLKVADNPTSRGLIASLVAERITGETDPTYVNDDMLRGILHEPFARDRYAEVNGVQVQEMGFLLRQESGWTLGASPDGLIGDGGGLEVKCPRAKTHIQTIVANEVPAQYVPQVQASLLVSGRKWWDFVSFCAGLPLFSKRVYPDPEWHAAIVAALVAFEQSASALTDSYLTASGGLPSTERVPDLEVVI